MPIPNGISEHELVQKCRTGDLKHLEKLYKLYYGYAMGVGLRYLKNRDDVLEVVNDAFIKAFKSLGSYNDSMVFKAWFRKIVINTALDRYRKNLRQVELVELDHAYNIGTAQIETDSLTMQDILKLLDALPEMHRTVFNMYEIDGYSHDEIAKMIDIPASSSRVYLTRAKEKLRGALEKSVQHEQSGRKTYQ